MSDEQTLLSVAANVVEKAKAAGAHIAEVIVRSNRELSTKVRLGKPEFVEEAASKGVGLRVMRDQRVASTLTSDLSDEGIARLVEDAIEIVSLTQADEHAGAPDPSLLSKVEDHPELEKFDAQIGSIHADKALELALEGEQAALDFDSKIQNSEGATFGRVLSQGAIVTSGGFQAFSRGTYASLVVNPIVDDEGGKKRSGHYWCGRRFLEDMESPQDVGRKAAERTLEKLGAQKLSTRQVPVIFDPDAGRSIIGLLAGCISGGAIWRKGSYLVDREDTQVASSLVNIVDDPLLVRAPGSRPFDGEGLLACKNEVVDRGILKTYLLDTYAAKKLGKQSTGSAGRNSDGSVGVTTSNFLLQAGEIPPSDLLADTEGALYVTQMMGQGFNPTTGDFSRGASGFWIEKGKRKFPVSEVTISLNLDEILKRIDAIANDLVLNSSVAAPTFRVSEMTVAGN